MDALGGRRRFRSDLEFATHLLEAFEASGAKSGAEWDPIAALEWYDSAAGPGPGGAAGVPMEVLAEAGGSAAAWVTVDARIAAAAAAGELPNATRCVAGLDHSFSYTDFGHGLAERACRAAGEEYTESSNFEVHCIECDDIIGSYNCGVLMYYGVQ